MWEEIPYQSEDEDMVRLGRADRIQLTRRLLVHCPALLLSAVFISAVAWGVLVPALWGLLGLKLKALAGYHLAVPLLGSVPALTFRLALFFAGVAALAALVLLGLNNLIADCLEGEAPGDWAEAVLVFLAPWGRWAGISWPLALWLGLAAVWGATLALASLAPYAGLVPVLAGAVVFALLHNCAMWQLVRPEQEEPGLWAALALPFRVLGHSDVLWRQTFSLGLVLALPSLAAWGAALSPLVRPGWWTGLLFFLGAALLVPALTFFLCYFALTYKQALANYRLRVRPAPWPEPRSVAGPAPAGLEEITPAGRPRLQ